VHAGGKVLSDEGHREMWLDAGVICTVITRRVTYMYWEVTCVCCLVLLRIQVCLYVKARCRCGDCSDPSGRRCGSVELVFGLALVMGILIRGWVIY